MNTENRKFITVTQLNTYIKNIMDRDELLSYVYLKGEISNFTNHYKSGHFYFSLKDETGVISAVMFKSSADKIKFQPKDGMKVFVAGKVTTFVRDGKYQIYVTSMEPDGIGALYVAFEQLKENLSKEGLFDSAHKLPLPKIPTKVGVITSSTGAAVRDIINVISRRFPFAEIILYPVLVQGENCASSVISALEYFESNKNVDVIILGRGGGSIEDLWGFNDESLARKIYSMTIPTISAVGHEIDFTISDFVADMRAPTPSAAAEICVPDINELKRKIDNVKNYIRVHFDKKIKQAYEKLNSLKNSKVLQNPIASIELKRMTLDFQTDGLLKVQKIKLSKEKERFSSIAAKLEALNPMSILLRGYSVSKNKDGKVIESITDVNKGDFIEIDLKDGKVDCKAVEVRKNG